ncbi:MAG: Mur ligase family protein [Paludibacter sp.]|nr:Mur ligase family protein [Bacteroidales bacterium]MCM1068455.1 Mur ligase family protein [Prevotella sp.]MCM1353409.1 Mur ligase family protein [Bacteroides sp.]MCM1442570.1 Mur ligase family protein [Muribaculum sp.]MCM1481415.1 Mur ligase family protein [Paludibacter sp.]
MNIHFIAIGGAAMHNLALAVASKPGYKVTGSDDEIFDPARSRLAAKGLLPAEPGWHPERITEDTDAVILGMHAREDNPELLRAKELGIRIYSFPEYLYEQTKDKTRIVVGGSHGKTTTTAMILYVLRKLGIETDYMVGAQIAGFDTMVRLSTTAKYAVFEGDEYLTSPLDLRSKFHWYHPHVAILTGIAWDHINVFPTFEKYVDTFRQFVGLMEPAGKLIYYKGDKELCGIAAHAREDLQCIGYDTPAFTIEQGVTYIGEERVPLKVFGRHNLQNMHAAQLACAQIGINAADFYRAVSDFTGASNRLEKVAEKGNSVAYKDFAHSPSKLRATVNAVREQYPKRRVIACMELHTFSSLMADFLPQYKDCMSEADVAFVYFNPKVIAHKRLVPIDKEDVRKAFGTDNVTVLTDAALLRDVLREMDYTDSVLLLMTSGTYDGMDIPTFANELISRENHG